MQDGYGQESEDKQAARKEASKNASYRCDGGDDDNNDDDDHHDDADGLCLDDDDEDDHDGDADEGSISACPR